MSVKPKILGVDGNWILHRVFHTTTYETSDKGRAIAYNFLSRVCLDAIAVKATHLLVAFDGSSVFRYDLYPEYKGQRGDNSEVYAFLPEVKRLLKAAGITVIHRKKFESDDVLRSLAEAYPYDVASVVLGTRDKDAYQGLREGVQLYDSSYRVRGELRPRFVSAADVLDIFGVPAGRPALEYQILFGDGTDNVPHLMGAATAKKGLLKWGSIKAWCKGDPKMAAWFRENRDRLVLNRSLVELRADVALPELEDLLVGPPSDVKAMPKPWHAMNDMMHPKSKGLF